MVLMVVHGADVPTGSSRVPDARRGARLTLEAKLPFCARGRASPRLKTGTGERVPATASAK